MGESLELVDFDGKIVPFNVAKAILKTKGPVSWLQNYIKNFDLNNENKLRYGRGTIEDSTLQVTGGRKPEDGDLIIPEGAEKLVSFLQGNEKNLDDESLLPALAFSIKSNLGIYFKFEEVKEDLYKLFRELGEDNKDFVPNLNGHILWALANEWDVGRDKVSKKIMEELEIDDPNKYVEYLRICLKDIETYKNLLIIYRDVYNFNQGLNRFMDIDGDTYNVFIGHETNSNISPRQQAGSRTKLKNSQRKSKRAKGYCAKKSRGKLKDFQKKNKGTKGYRAKKSKKKLKGGRR